MSNVQSSRELEGTHFEGFRRHFHSHCGEQDAIKARPHLWYPFYSVLHLHTTWKHSSFNSRGLPAPSANPDLLRGGQRGVKTTSFRTIVTSSSKLLVVVLPQNYKIRTRLPDLRFILHNRPEALLVCWLTKL
jgi:hypothetical protein